MRMLRRWIERLMRPFPAVTPPRAPDGMTIYAIGDVHGERVLLERLLDLLRRDADGRPEAPVAVFLGDYVDRGPDSRGVLELLCADPLPGMAVRRLLGNHEQAMLDFLEAPQSGAGWLDFGGIACLDSYGVRLQPGSRDPARLIAWRDELQSSMPAAHLALLMSLERWVVYGDYVFVHAGIRPGTPLAEQALADLLWIREPFLDWPDPHEKVVVHGHSIRPVPQRLPNRIGIDTGAYATGVLTAVALTGEQVRFLQVRR